MDVSNRERQTTVKTKENKQLSGSIDCTNIALGDERSIALVTRLCYGILSSRCKEVLPRKPDRTCSQAMMYHLAITILKNNVSSDKKSSQSPLTV